MAISIFLGNCLQPYTTPRGRYRKLSLLISYPLRMQSKLAVKAMLLNNSQTDPIVEILRLAYRRGLALRQEQEKEKGETVDLDPQQKPTEHAGLQPERVQAQDG